jgi:hypothetical protein
MQPNRTFRQQVIDECQRIETLAKLIAEAASYQFGTPIDDECFEAGEGSDYANCLRTLRIRIERAAHCLEGLDPRLDEQLSDYCRQVLRANPSDIRPSLFQLLN